MQLLIGPVFKFQTGMLSAALQAAHHVSLIDTCTRLSLSDHLMLLWKMQRGLTGTGNTLGRFDNEGSRKHMCGSV